MGKYTNEKWIVNLNVNEIPDDNILFLWNFLFFNLKIDNEIVQQEKEKSEQKWKVNIKKIQSEFSLTIIKII